MYLHKIDKTRFKWITGNATKSNVLHDAVPYVGQDLIFKQLQKQIMWECRLIQGNFLCIHFCLCLVPFKLPLHRMHGIPFSAQDHLKV